MTRTVVAQPGDDYCLFDVEVTWKNVGTHTYKNGLWVGMHDNIPADAGGYYTNSTKPVAMVDGDYETYSKLTKIEKKGPEKLEGPVQWFGLSDYYFGSVLLPDDEAGGTATFSMRTLDNGDNTFGAHWTADTPLAAGASHTATFKMFLGPKRTEVLKGVDPDLPKLIKYRWFGFFGKILLFLLKIFQSGVVNWGVAIICLTLLIKGLFFPLTHKAFKSSQAMAALQPQLKALKEKHKDDQAEIQKQTLALFKDNKVNPLGGCLPMIIQMPVWIALYDVLLYSVELYQQQFIYIKDLSSPDPYCVLPAIVVGLMLVQQRFTPMGNMDPAQARIMKLMPLIFGFFFFTFPSGLVVYIFINMVLTITQQWVIRRAFNKETPASAVPATTK